MEAITGLTLNGTAWTPEFVTALDPKKCIGCGRCKESCPVDTIRMADGKARILPEKCIRCFCCQEMCPAGAVEIRRLGIFNW